MFYSKNENELIDYGFRLGRLLQAQDVLILSGDLGAGKTTLTKGIAKGLGISQMVKSPTYTIVREYEGNLPLYHLDVYRIGDDPDSIDLDDFIYGDGVTVIEWGELLDEGLFQDYLHLFIVKRDNGRAVQLEAKGSRAKEIIEKLTNDQTDCYHRRSSSL
ncbi:tRNA (adenosine(37)-N6)-threonylcarbamoyltransferase complex ATPase subunit type 1 TsaE [Streptococcus didelphis]|uniref:tRNA (adenosine(37)-N6)-threonylcarbamoyltransferase complex ATPase subunit type 1 TsaE n=1 Tax=Streptococcus didelphis TaxID=102886 RepID=UPI00068787BD|nr:tRNA (adenosine(37)-N6)-threonylcarbamoyltransferase complex ATPase subunit type 1 TsaE [Streptococcus didelphis]